jgi:hypothetical protein
VAFGAVWRPSVIAIWRIDLVVGADSKRAVNVLQPLGGETVGLRDHGTDHYTK